MVFPLKVLVINDASIKPITNSETIITAYYFGKIFYVYGGKFSWDGENETFTFLYTV